MSLATKVTGPLPKRVLHVLGSPSGGSAVSTATLIRTLEDEFGITSCAVSPPGRLEAERSALSDATDGRVYFLPLYRWEKRSKLPPARRAAIAARHALRTRASVGSTRQVADFAVSQGVDLIHSSTISTPEGGQVARKLGLPHVLSIRELMGPGQPFRFYGENWLFRRRLDIDAATFVANSETCRRHAAPILDGTDIGLIRNGIELDPLLALDAPRFDGPLRIGMVASLEVNWKRHELFLRAAAALADENLEFRVVGDIPDNDSYADRVLGLKTELGLDDRLEFCGHAPSPSEAMAQLDILVHPARNESFGRVLVEAMAAGRPVISVDEGGAQETLDHGAAGILVAPDDVEALAHSIRQLVNDRAEARRLSNAGRERARYYSADRMATAYAQVYSGAMSEDRFAD